MAVKNYYLGAGNDGNFGALVDGVAQTAASRTDGWTVAKIASGNSAEFDAGTKQASGTFTAQSSGPKPGAFLTGTTANAFKTPAALTGTFAATTWAFSHSVRATTASSQAGRIRLRVFKSVNASGASATELTTSTVVSNTSAALTTAADATVTTSWAPGTTITLNNEYLFFAIAWEITTASGSNSGDVVYRTGSTTVTSCFVTTDFVAFTPKAITPAAISATSTVGGSLTKTVAPIQIVAAAVSATSTVGGSLTKYVGVTRPIAPSAQPYRDRILSLNPLAYWRLGESAGTTAVDQNGIFNGTYSGVVLGQPGAISGSGDNDTSALFGASGAAVSIPSDTRHQGLSTWTVEAWVYRTGTPTNEYAIVSHYYNGNNLPIVLGGETSGNVWAGFYSNPWYRTPEYFVPLNTWMHLVGTWDGTNLCLYANGVLVTTAPASGWAPAALDRGPVPLRISQRWDTSDGWPGYIDEVAIYPAALPSGVIAANYQSGITAPSALIKATSSVGGTSIIDFPGIRDDFNRADGPIYAGAGAAIWENHPLSVTTLTQAAVSGNCLSSPNQDHAIYKGVLASDFDMYWDCVAMATGVGFFFAMTASDTSAHNTVTVGYDQGTSAWWGVRYNGGGSGQSLGSRSGPMPQPGETWRLSKRGATFTLAKATAVAGPYTQAVSFVGSISGFTSGQVGIQLYSSSDRWDNFRAGPFYAPPVVAPATPIFATSTVSGSVLALHKILPANISAASTVSGSVLALRKVAPAQVAATASVSGSIKSLRAVQPTQISATSTVSGSLRVLRAIKPTQIAATSTVSAVPFTVRRAIAGQIAATSTVSGSLTKYSGAPKLIVTTQISATSTVSGTVTKGPVKLLTGNVAATSTVGSGVGTVVTDNFNRSDNSNIGPNWTNSAEGSPAILNNKVSSPGIGGATWTANTFGNDQFAQITGMALGNVSDANSVSGLMLRSQLAGATCYHARIFSNSGSPAIQVYKRVNPASLSQVGSNVPTPNPSISDVLRFEISGSTLTVKLNGVVQFTTTDTSIPSGGGPGVRFNGNSSADDFTGGDIGGGNAIRVIRKLIPAQVNATSTVGGSVQRVGATKPIAPTQINAASVVSGVVYKTARISPVQVLATSTVGAVIRQLRAVRPAQIAATSTVSGSVGRIGALRPIVTAQVSATSVVSGLVYKITKITSAQVSATSTVSGNVSTHPVKIISGVNVAATSTVSGSLRVARGVLSAQIAATSTVTGSVRASRRVAAAQINAISTVSGLIIAARRVATTQINATSTVSGKVFALHKITTAQVNAISTVVGSLTVRLPKIISGGNVNAASTVTGRITVRRFVTTTAQVAAISTVSGRVGVVRPVKPAIITATSTVTGIVTPIRGVFPAHINAFSVVSASVITTTIKISASKLQPGTIVHAHRGRTSLIGNTERIQLTPANAEIAVGDRGMIELGERDKV